MNVVKHEYSVGGVSLVKINGGDTIICNGEDFLDQFACVIFNHINYGYESRSLPWGKLYNDLKNGKISVGWSIDDHYCECCGVNFAEGYFITVGDEVYRELEPVAGCLGSSNFCGVDVILYLFDIYGVKYILDGERSNYLTLKNSQY